MVLTPTQLSSITGTSPSGGLQKANRLPSQELGSLPEPYGDTYRGIGSSWFNAENIAREDFIRDLQLQEYNNNFNSSEAEKSREHSSSEAQIDRDWQSNENRLAREYDERMSNTQYQRAIEDMKIAGINPILAYSQGGSDYHASPSGSGSRASSATASSGSSSRTRSGSNDSLSSLLVGFVKIAAGAVSGQPAPVVSGFTDVITSSGTHGKVHSRTYKFK